MNDDITNKKTGRRESCNLDDQDIINRAGEQAAKVLQQLIRARQPVSLDKVEIYHLKTNKESHKQLAERLLSLWRADSIVVQTEKFIFKEQGNKFGKVVTIIPQNDALVLVNDILEPNIEKGNEFKK